jgi:protein O-mannosyl-transferase
MINLFIEYFFLNRLKKIVGLEIMNKKTKQLHKVKTAVSKSSDYKFSKQTKYSVFGIILILCLILYGNTLNHKYALDDKMAVYQNRFVLKGADGIGELFRTDFFHGFFGKFTNNVEGGRYRPLSLVSYAIEYELFMTNAFKGLEYKQLQLKIDGSAKVSGKSNENSKLEELHKQLNKSLLLDNEKDRIFRQQQLLGMHKVLIDSEKTAIINNLKVSYGDLQTVMFVSHLVNILLYAIAGILLFIFMARLCIKIPYKKWYLSVPFVTVILFIAHPLHTEVVANIKGRDEIMSLLFSLAAGIFIFKYLESKKPLWLVMIFCFFSCSYVFERKCGVIFGTFSCCHLPLYQGKPFESYCCNNSFGCGFCNLYTC